MHLFYRYLTYDPNIVASFILCFLVFVWWSLWLMIYLSQNGVPLLFQVTLSRYGRWSSGYSWGIHQRNQTDMPSLIPATQLNHEHYHNAKIIMKVYSSDCLIVSSIINMYTKRHFQLYSVADFCRQLPECQGKTLLSYSSLICGLWYTMSNEIVWCSPWSLYR